MDLSHDDVLEILQLIESSKIGYLELQVGETRIVADRTGRGPRAEGTAPPAARPAPAPPVGTASAPVTPQAAPTPEPIAASESVATPPAAPAAPTSAPASSTDEDLVVVSAPVVGIFYRAPEPGADPFVEVGATIPAGATLGLVEVMKMFNGVTADVGGEVVEILAENEEFVEFGQPLVTIRPEPSA
jgi:acetyl-CoA carboxylase biotin carboxyl carrier protein